MWSTITSKIESLDKRKWIAAAAFWGGLGVTIGSYWTMKHQYIHTVSMNTGFLFIALGVGIVIINLFLEDDKHRKVISTVFSIIKPSFFQARKETLDLIYNQYRVDEFVNLIHDFIEAGGDYNSLPIEEQTRLYKLILANHQKLVGLFSSLANDVREILSIAGGSINDLGLMLILLRFERDSMLFLKSDPQSNFDPDAQRDLVEQFLDCVIGAYDVHSEISKIESKLFSSEESGWILK